MATEILRPNSNINMLWTTYDYTNIDDVVEDPSTGGDATKCNQGRKDDNEQQEWGFENPSTLSDITSCNVWVRHAWENDNTSQTEGINLRATIDGTSLGPFTVTTSSGGIVWDNYDFTGTWTASDFDDFQVSLDGGTLDTEDDYFLHVVYAELTGTAGGDIWNETGSGGAVSAGDSVQGPEILTGILRPNEDVTSVYGTYTAIDDVVLTGNPGDGTNAESDRNDDSEQSFGFTDPIEDFGRVYEITVHIRHGYQDSRESFPYYTAANAGIRVKMDGVWETSQNVTTSGSTEYIWDSVTFTGEWNRSDLYDIEVGVDPVSMSSLAEDWYMDVLYVEASGYEGSVAFDEIATGGAVAAGDAVEGIGGSGSSGWIKSIEHVKASSLNKKSGRPQSRQPDQTIIIIDKHHGNTNSLYKL